MAEPILFQEAALHLRLGDDDSEQDLIESYITAARQWVENHTGHILLQREFTEYRDSFGRYLELHRRPILADPEPTIAYIDSEGASQDYAEAVYSLDRYPARIHPALDGSWPSLGLYGGVTITYVAGYEPGNEPRPLLQAVLLLVDHFYNNRGVTLEKATNEVPFTVSALCDQYRAPSL